MNMEFLKDGSEGCPLIRIFGTDRDEFSSLHRVIMLLASGEVKACRADEINGLPIIGDCVLTLTASAQDEGVSREGHTSNFIWKLTPKKWSVVAGFIEPFLSDPRLGSFQWLAGKEARHGLDVGAIAILLSHSNNGQW